MISFHMNNLESTLSEENICFFDLKNHVSVEQLSILV